MIKCLTESRWQKKITSVMAYQFKRPTANKISSRSVGSNPVEGVYILFFNQGHYYLERIFYLICLRSISKLKTILECFHLHIDYFFYSCLLATRNCSAPFKAIFADSHIWDRKYFIEFHRPWTSSFYLLLIWTTHKITPRDRK